MKMNDSDIDFEDTFQQRNKKPQNSSRRRKNVEEEDENFDSMLDSALKTQRFEEPPKRNNKVEQPRNSQNRPSQAINGWGDEALTFNSQAPTVKNHRREPGTGFETEIDEKPEERRETKPKIHKREMNDDYDDNIPDIPDLEEANDADDFAFQVAEAPDIQVHQISTYKELDKEFYKDKPFQYLEGNIDVSLLHCGLNAETQITEEDDVIWEWSKLFTEVVSLLTVEEDIKSEETPKGEEKKTFI